MTQMSLDRQVAKLTGETVATIRRMGFHIACPPQIVLSREPNADQLENDPATIDWDRQHAWRVGIVPCHRDPVAA